MMADRGPGLEKRLAILDRLSGQNQRALDDFFVWIEHARHTQTVSLVFHDGKLRMARMETTSGRD